MLKYLYIIYRKESKGGIGLIGEVIESKTSEFVVEAREYDVVPCYGSFVKVIDGDRIVYGIVSGAYTGSIDNNTRAKAFFKSIEELKREQPQIFSLLRTEFNCVVAGYSEKDIFNPYYPPAHPRLHLSVEKASDDEIIKATEGFGYLSKTINYQAGDSDELTAAALRNAAFLRDKPREYVVSAGRELLKMLSYDTGRLKNIIDRVGMR
jgi:hypothetical protein